MSSTKYNVPYEYVVGDQLERRKFFVHHFHTMDMTTIYDEAGNVVFWWDVDSLEKRDALLKILAGDDEDIKGEWVDFPERADSKT